MANEYDGPPEIQALRQELDPEINRQNVWREAVHDAAVAVEEGAYDAIATAHDLLSACPPPEERITENKRTI